MKKTVMALLLFMGAAFPSVVGYHIDPVKAQWSGWTPSQFPNNYVEQQVVVCWDSLERVELFAGAKGSGGTYHAAVYDGNTLLMSSDGTQSQSESWVQFYQWDQQVAFTKGKTLTVRFTRSGDSIEYYYGQASGGGPYQYGNLLVNGTTWLDKDLCMRAYGRMNPVSDVWRACTNHGNDPPFESDSAVAALAKAKSMGVQWLKDDFLCWGTWGDTWDAHRDSCMDVYHRYKDAFGFNMVGTLCYGSNDSTQSSGPPGAGSWGCYPPRYLWANPESGQVNYWAQYCQSIMESMPAVKYWEVFPEANADWYWKDPDIAWYHGSRGMSGDPIDTPRERCSLYVRMCRIAESTAHWLGGDTLRKVLGGAPFRLVDPEACTTGVGWLGLLFDIATKNYGAAESCFDVVSVHHYMYYDDRPSFTEEDFRKSLDTARLVMRQAGYPGMELWATEYGWPRWDKKHSFRPLTDTLTQADNVCKFYTSAMARQADPRGGYDRAIHYELTSDHVSWDSSNNGYGLLDSLDSQPRMPSGWAFAQESVLTGKRLNGRVMTGDTAIDSHTWTYEFEDTTALKKRTWVCWQDEAVSAYTPVPVRSDIVDTVALAYNGSPPTGQQDAESSGWLHIALQPRPRFVTEKSDTCRPDLVVDSLKLVPSPVAIGHPATAHVYFHNAGNAPTPVSGPLSNDYTWVVLRHNGDSVARAATHSSLNPGNSDSVSISLDSVPASWRGTALFDATANYEQKYVEMNGMDDNDGYRRTSVVWLPQGELIGVVCDGHSNEPPALLRIETHSIEADTTGQTGCDSARLVQYWLGLNDTVVHGGDTTGWFCVSQPTTFDTCWRYLFGQGRYRLGLIAKDSWSTSDLIFDTTHPYVVFDTTRPTGSIVIDGGERFAGSSTVTLRLVAHDSASGVGWMRFINSSQSASGYNPFGLVENGGFALSANGWEMDNADVDSLSMARLSVTPVAASVRQFIPAESISAHSGDSCVLEADILARVNQDGATGSASLWYLSTRADSVNFHDTLWQLADSAGFTGNLLSLTGRCDLSKRFQLMPPVSDSVWVWKGGMVKVEASAENGNGSVWVDNVALNTFAPESGYAWWGPYDTLAVWNIGSGAGQHTVRMCLLDSAGNENATPYADTIILDPTPPVVHISLPSPGQLVSGSAVEVTGWAYDPVEVSNDIWFKVRHLFFREADSTNWLPVSPDSVSHTPAYADSQRILGPAVHLGYWNTASIPDGTYYVMVTGADSAGHVSSCTTWVIVSNGGAGGGGAGGPGGGGSGLGQGSIYVGSSTGTVLHLSDALDSLDCFSISDSGSPAYITSILEVGTDSLLVLDARNRRIHKLHRSGQHRRRLVSGLSQPVDIKRDTNNNLWLADRGWNRVGKFRPNGTLVFVRGGLGSDSLHFHSPEGVAVKGSLVYVADAGNNRIAVWDTAGNYKATITGDFGNPTAVMVTDSGAIYLTDGNDGKLKGITPLGGNIFAMGTSDSSKLRGLVLSENKHSLFSIAPLPNKVYKLRIQSDDSAPGGQQSAGNIILPKKLSLGQPFPNPARTRLHVAYALPHQTRVVLRFYDVAGKLVTTLANGDQKPGYHSLTWNRQDAKGRSCPCGIYFCTLSAENQRFSRKVVLTE